VVIRRTIARSAATLVALLQLAQGVAPAAAQGLRPISGPSPTTLRLSVDQARIFQADRPFAEIQIAQPEIAEVQPLNRDTIYVLGRSRGRTSLALLDDQQRLIASATVVVSPDIEELKERLAALLPRARIEVRSAGGGVVLSGAVDDAASVERAMAVARAYAGDDVTNLLTVGSRQQVSLQVRIAEMSRTAAKELGISLGANTAGADYALGAATLGGIADPFGAIGAALTIGDVLLNVSIDALEEKGFARTLAEPNLVALSGGEAEFLAGGQVPIPIRDEDGDVDVEFRSVGVSLGFEPTVLEDDTISLALATEVAAIDDTIEVLGIPGFLVRRASTTIELRDGQSFAIAGLYQDDFADNIRQAPWLGDIPVLGTLFRSTEFRRGESELVVIVSANLVAPVEDRRAIPLPFDRIRIPNERELFLMGQTVVDRPGFAGDYGYVLE
jgi:pilus assembly protein CpaC